jgi:hypothetical protein
VSTGKTGSITGRFGPGHDPRRGHGLPGRSGRKGLDFIAHCRSLTDGVVIEKIGLYLQDPERGPADPAWRWCSEYVSRYVKVGPRQPIDGNEDKIPLSIIRKAIARARQLGNSGGSKGFMGARADSSPM